MPKSLKTRTNKKYKKLINKLERINKKLRKTKKNVQIVGNQKQKIIKNIIELQRV